MYGTKVAGIIVINTLRVEILQHLKVELKKKFIINAISKR
jgi:hypothetical protein